MLFSVFIFYKLLLIFNVFWLFLLCSSNLDKTNSCRNTRNDPLYMLNLKSNVCLKKTLLTYSRVKPMQWKNSTCNMIFFNRAEEIFKHIYFNNTDSRFAKPIFLNKSSINFLRDKAKAMFTFGYDCYMKCAFPEDELNPLECSGRGPDSKNVNNININDVLGDYVLTLVDSMDTLAIMGNSSEFKRAVLLIQEYVKFDRENTVQVFEATIRVLGALISSHLIITDPKQPFGDMRPVGYNNELLHLAVDLATRLMPAFKGTATGIPYPRVNLRHGVPRDVINETCLAGAGSLLLEFGALSQLTGDRSYADAARKSVRALWRFRSNVTGLLGNVIDVQTGEFVSQMSGLGAGSDSYFEYLLKAHVLFGDNELLQMFRESMDSIRFHLKRGRKFCHRGIGHPPLYVNVHMSTGELLNYWVDSLQASWPGLLVLDGQIQEAICAHAFYMAVWRKYNMLPERFNWHLREPDVRFYPLRPELAESTYLLYKATGNPFYLEAGQRQMEDLERHARASCGYATIHDVGDKSHEDRMESFFLSETCKYLFLLFDVDNPMNVNAEDWLFTTEGHPLPIKRLRNMMQLKPSHLSIPIQQSDSSSSMLKAQENREMSVPITVPSENKSHVVKLSSDCEALPRHSQFALPLQRHYLEQIDSVVGANLP